MKLELRLLLVCAKVHITQEDETSIRQMLDEGIDWTIFAQNAIDRGLASHAGHTLLRVVPDMVPDDILDALHKIVAQTNARNREVLDQVEQIVKSNSPQGAVLPIRDAHAVANRALTANPNDAAAWRTFGRALHNLGRQEETLACYSRAIELVPEHAAAWRERGRALLAMNQTMAALVSVDKALVFDPLDDGAWTLRARALWTLRRFAEAVEASDRALALDEGSTTAVLVGIESRLCGCDWHRREDDKRHISEGLRAGKRLISPLFHRAISDSEGEQFVLAGLRARAIPPSPALWCGERYRHDKIRIAYMSTDFRDHVVADAIAGCFELHDKARFETIAISVGPDDGSAMRRRIEAAFDRFIDVRSMSDAEAAAMLRASEIDIVIDLNGYSGHPRTGILARRPAPIQVNYFGYPGTMAAPFMDYIMADPWLIPEGNRVYYSEQVVYLPYTYLPTDKKRPVAADTASRAQEGLPTTGFVFACLHNSFKISPEMLDIWARLLHGLENSVLWFLGDNKTASSNLRDEAKQRGIDPERLVFAPRKELAEHIARLKLGDLYLDTLPYNAHTSASDALWAGLPLLTCPGNTFAGRVAAALLHAIGLPELVAASLDEYEEIAHALAHDPKRMAAIKSKLIRNRDTAPLFDTARFTRDLQTAYSMMQERQQMGLPAVSFSVPATT